MNADSQSIVFNPGPSGFVLTQLTLILNDATGHQQFLTETSQSTVGTYISSIVCVSSSVSQLHAIFSHSDVVSL